MKDEINLLPPSINSFRIRVLAWKKIGHLLRLCIVLLLILLAALGSAEAVILTTENISPNKPRSSTSLKEVKKNITEANEALGAISVPLNKISPWTILIPEILQAAPQGISLAQLSADEKSRSLTINGIYNSFDEVVSYKQRLEQLKWVKTVTAPLDNFTTDSSARFTITITR